VSRPHASAYAQCVRNPFRRRCGGFILADEFFLGRVGRDDEALLRSLETEWHAADTDAKRDEVKAHILLHLEELNRASG